MADFSFSNELINIKIDENYSLKFRPQELLDLTDQSYHFLLNNKDKFTSLVKKVEKNSLSFKVTFTNNLSFWKDLEDNIWEPETFQVFDRFLNDETYYFDIGAWIGPTVLYCAQKTKKAFAFEPDPSAFRELKANYNANTGAKWYNDVEIFNAAISDKPGKIRIGNEKSFGNSNSSILFADEKLSVEVDSISLINFIKEQKLIDKKLFLKIDIEGGEFLILPKIKDFLKELDVTIYLSVHSVFINSFRNKNLNEFIKFPFNHASFVYRHYKLLNALPFKNIYNAHGKKLNKGRELLKALFLERFPAEIVLTNENW